MPMLTTDVNPPITENGPRIPLHLDSTSRAFPKSQVYPAPRKEEGS